MPAGGEAAARRFYADLLGIPEVTKPPELDRGGVWFEKDNVRIHLGVELDFRAAQKAHPGLLVKEFAIPSREAAGRRIHRGRRRTTRRPQTRLRQ